MRQRHRFDLIQKTWLIWPAVILMLIFFISPIILTFVYSFTNLALTGSAAKDVQFIGLGNYIQMFKNTDVWLSIRATLIFWGGRWGASRSWAFSLPF